MPTSKVRLPISINLLLSLLIFLSAAQSDAQVTTASLSGNVTDPSGAVVTDATVTATNIDTGISSKSMSDAVGNYIVPRLSPGAYTITVEKAGFKATVIPGIKLLVNQQATIDARMQVGEATTKVEVSGVAAPLVETNTASVGTVIEQHTVEELPLNERRYGALAVLVPGTVASTTGPGQVGDPSGSPFGDTTYNANGARSEMNNYLIDGVDAKNSTYGGFSLQPSPDAIQEFKIQTNIYDAAFGKSAGSTINLVTKSGTNAFHGAVYDYLRNDKLDALNFFATTKSELRRNQFGGAIGGPVIKNKTFFFFNYEGLRLIQGSVIRTLVPTDAEKSGDLSSALTGRTVNLCGAGGPSNLNFDTGQLFDPSTESLVTCPPGSANAGSTVLTGTAIPGNIITNVDPVAQAALALYPEPNLAGAFNFIITDPVRTRQNQYDVRIDHTLGSKDQLFGRYLRGKSYTLQPLGVSSLRDFWGIIDYLGQNIGLGWTHTFGPRLLNEARFGFQRENNNIKCEVCPRPAGTLDSFGVGNLHPLGPQYEGVPWFNVGGFEGLGDSPSLPLLFPGMIEIYQDHLTWTHGRHTVRAGADMNFRQTLGRRAPFGVYGRLHFSGQFSSLGNALPDSLALSGLADLLQGFPSAAERSIKIVPLYFVGSGKWSFYGQDDIKVSRNLVVNVGLRYEYWRPPIDKNNNYLQMWPIGPKFSGPGNALLVTPLPDSENDALCSDPAFSYLNSSDGRCLIASSAQRRQFGFTGRAQRALIFAEKNNFAPRLGVAWRPLNSDRLVVRTGAGIFFDSVIDNEVMFGLDNPIFSPTQIFTTAFGSPPPQTGGVPTTVHNVFSGGGIPTLDNQVIELAVDPHFRNARLYEWSLGIGSQIFRDVGLDVSYIGNKGQNLASLHFFGNQPRPGFGPLQPRRPYPDFGMSNFVSSEDDSSYNALQAKLTKRFSHGLSILTSYTYSKALSDGEGDTDFAGGHNVQDDNNRNDWGRTSNDVRHILAVSYVLELPFGKNRRFLNRGGLVDGILGGWQASGITSWHTGFPVSIFASDFGSTGSFYTRADSICKDNGNNGPKTLTEWFDTSCFTVDKLVADAQAGRPRFGNSGRDIVTMPGYQNWDFSLAKSTLIREQLKLQFRAEFFNVFNHPNFGGYGGGADNGFGSPTFGQIHSALSPRDIQFALRLSF